MSDVLSPEQQDQLYGLIIKQLDEIAEKEVKVFSVNNYTKEMYDFVYNLAIKKMGVSTESIEEAKLRALDYAILTPGYIFGAIINKPNLLKYFVMNNIIDLNSLAEYTLNLKEKDGIDLLKRNIGLIDIKEEIKLTPIEKIQSFENDLTPSNNSQIKNKKSEIPVGTAYVGQIEMHEFIAIDADAERKTGKFELFNVYVFVEHLPLFLFQIGEDIEERNNDVIAGMANFLFSKDIHLAHDNNFITAGIVTKKINDKWFMYKATAKTWRTFIAKTSKKLNA